MNEPVPRLKAINWIADALHDLDVQASKARGLTPLDDRVRRYESVTKRVNRHIKAGRLACDGNDTIPIEDLLEWTKSSS
jgi:hypothetical protein